MKEFQLFKKILILLINNYPKIRYIIISKQLHNNKSMLQKKINQILHNNNKRWKKYHMINKKIKLYYINKNLKILIKINNQLKFMILKYNNKSNYKKILINKK